MELCNFSLSKKSERDLHMSEQEKGWWVAYGSSLGHAFDKQTWYTFQSSQL